MGQRYFAIAEQPALQRLLRVLVAVSVLTNVAYGVSIFAVSRPSGGYVTFWDGWVFFVGSMLPVGVVAIKAMTDGRLRAAWWPISAGVLLNCVGNLIYTYHDQNLRPIPNPGPADAAYLASYLAFAVGLVVFMRHNGQDQSRSALLDGLVVGLAAGAVAVALWFEPILAQSGSRAQVLVGLAYPLCDVVFIVIVIAGLAPQRYRPTRAAMAFMAGAAVFALGDVVYLNQTARSTYQPSTWLELTWTLGILGFAIAPWLPETRRNRDPGDLAPGLLVVPALCALVSLCVIALGLSGGVSPLASWLGMASVAIALARVIYTVRELRRANEAFGQARTDELTQLLNRRGFIEQLDRLLSDDPSSIALVIDLDGFKEVNDSLGHHAGDVLLGIVGNRFARVLPTGASLARLGGDEFGVAFPGDHATAADAARALLDTLTNPIALEAISIRVSASIGIACAPEHGTTRDELLRAADVAMYEAKRHQRGFAIYTPHTDPHSRDRLAFIEDLRCAVEQRTFEMHYQPTIDVASGDIAGMEALIRWRHPERGLLLPDEFIPLAERVGLMPGLTRAVLDQSVHHLARTRAAGYDLRLSANVSASDLVDESLPAYVRDLLETLQVPPSRLTLEITETALASDPVRAHRTLMALRESGIRISIDDFGVGYSSMSKLLELPVDVLKLDRSFVTNLQEDVRAQAILSATVELGRTLGLNIVAEGVETNTALTEITQRGVDTAQGFLFSPALPQTAFLAFVANAQPLRTTAGATHGSTPGGTTSRHG